MPIRPGHGAVTREEPQISSRRCPQVKNERGDGEAHEFAWHGRKGRAFSWGDSAAANGPRPLQHCRSGSPWFMRSRDYEDWCFPFGLSNGAVGRRPRFEKNRSRFPPGRGRRDLRDGMAGRALKINPGGGSLAALSNTVN